MEAICLWLFLTTGLLGPIQIDPRAGLGGILGQIETPLGENPVLLEIVYGGCESGMQPDVSKFNHIPLQSAKNVRQEDGSYFEQHPEADRLNK